MTSQKLVLRTKRGIQETFEALRIAAFEMRLTIDQNKTKYIEIIPRGNSNIPLTAINYISENVSHIKHLGTNMITLNDLNFEIINRLLMENKCYYDLETNLNIPC